MAKSDVKSFMSVSSKTEGSTTVLSRLRSRNAPLHERCSMSEMVKIKEAFEAAYRNKLLPTEFRNVLRTLLNVEYDDEEFNILFMKINTSRTGEIDWDELVSHLILGYFSNDPDNQRASLQLPIMGLPTVMRSQHRHPISRICFCPDVDKNRCTDPLQGNYIAASRDGMISWWSLDMTMLRSAYSVSPHLKVRTTWVTDAVCLPDVNIIVTSSTERDLRFYDSTAKTFTLKLIITSWEYMICTMYYHFSKDINEKCILICGDVGGNLRILLFSAIKRGPFRNQPGCSLQQLRHVDLQKRPHLLPEMTLTELRGVHGDWVRQVSYYAALHCVVSCATSADALLMTDLTGSKTHNVFMVDKGIQCFAFDEEAHVLATGGPDCIVRVWNPFVPSKASVILPGHHAGVVKLVLQNGGQTVYSLSRDRVVKVWDIQGQTCVQTYIDIPPQIGERTPISAVYNPATRELILAAIKIAIIVLDEELNPQHTDGFTHSRAVSKVLYNPLFKVVITCGMDSIIINWDPITGKRNAMVRDAHTRLLHGELIPVEITAACFDPGYQLLLTGARNGTLKVWNFNTGVCLRNMAIEHMCEVTSCFWVEGRILAVGWNRHVTEFEEECSGSSPGEAMGGGGKSWETRHSEDVMAAAARTPFTLATASYNSELIFWKMETGQPYRRFSCTEPALRITMQYSRRAAPPPSPPAARRACAVPRAGATGVRDAPIDSASAMHKARARRASSVGVAEVAGSAERPLAVHAMIFLNTRPCHMGAASLMVSLEDGQIQAWSEHPAGGLQGSFRGVHSSGDYVSAFTTDQDNDYLFTGTTIGYIKVWLMTNYLTDKEVHINMPYLRTTFPFLWRQRISGRALRAALRNPAPRPLLLSSARAHMRCVTALAYIDRMGLLLSGSSDYSVRAWRLSGQYVGTLGSFLPWDLDVTRFPADVKKVASSTTLRVWAGASRPSAARRRSQSAERARAERTSDARAPAAALPRPPRRPEPQAPPALDDSLPTIPLYAHLRLSNTQPVRRARTPELVRALRVRRETPHGQKRRGPKTHFEGKRQEQQQDDNH